MTARIVGAFARHESEHKSERIRRKHLELAEKGLPNGGGRRYGYEADGMTIREDEAEIVREMCSRFLAGDSIYSHRAGPQPPRRQNGERRRMA
jgi:site-specific DNA recombinase